MYLGPDSNVQDPEAGHTSHDRTPSLATTTTVASYKSHRVLSTGFEHRYCSRVYQHRRLRPQRHLRKRTRKPSLLVPKTSLDPDHNVPDSHQGGLDPYVVVQRLLETNSREEALLTGLAASLKVGGQKSPCAPSFTLSQSSSLEKYLWATSHPDPVRLCDIFFARFNLPYMGHMLTGSYDPIEMIHMCGWEEQEEETDIILVTQPLEGDRTSQSSEVHWRRVSQFQEPWLAQQISGLALQIRQQWTYQGRSVYEHDEANRPIAVDETVDLYRLGCPGSTKTIVYQSSYDASGSHVARKPWSSTNRKPLLGQLQVRDIPPMSLSQEARG